MAIIQKEKKFIDPIAIGGAPIYAEDLLNTQKNATTEALSFFEGLINNTGDIIQYTDLTRTTVAKQFKAGIWVHEPKVINSADTSAVELGEGVFLVDNELIYFPGGTFNLAANAGGQSIVICSKGPAVKTSRTFKDGNVKDLFVEYNAVLTASTENDTGVQIPSSVDTNNQHVVLSGATFIKPEHTVQGALKVVENTNRIAAIELLTTFESWNEFTKIGTVSGLGNNSLEYRKTVSGRVELRGAAVESGGASGSVKIGDLPSGYYATNREIWMLCGADDSGNPIFLKINTTGEVFLNKADTSNVTFAWDGLFYQL